MHESGRMDNTVNSHLVDELKKKAKELAALREIGKDISSSLDLETVLNTIADCAIDLLKGKKACIMLLDIATKKMDICTNRGLEKSEIEKLKNEFTKDISIEHVSETFLHTPLKTRDSIIGLIYVSNGAEGKTFTNHHLYILKELADQATIAIDNARAHTKLQDIALDTIRALAVTLDQRDHYTSCHSENVARYAITIAREMNLSEEEIDKIERASQLHDIGKIGINDYILSKPGKLTSQEWEEIKKHTIKGEEILKPLEFLNGIVDLVRQHHERYDGKGYPDGLKHKDIKLGARIMAVADSFDAMTSERPYRPALSREKAIEEIKQCSGLCYDPKVVKAFLRAVEQKII